MLSNGLRDKLTVKLRVSDLLDVHMQLLAMGDLLEVGTQVVGAPAAAAYNDPRLGGVHRNLDLVRGALDFDSGDPGRSQRFLYELPDVIVLEEQRGELLVRVPPALPVPNNSNAEPYWVVLSVPTSRPPFRG